VRHIARERVSVFLQRFVDYPRIWIEPWFTKLDSSNRHIWFVLTWGFRIEGHEDNGQHRSPLLASNAKNINTVVVLDQVFQETRGQIQIFAILILFNVVDPRMHELLYSFLQKYVFKLVLAEIINQIMVCLQSHDRRYVMLLNQFLNVGFKIWVLANDHILGHSVQEYFVILLSLFK